MSNGLLTVLVAFISVIFGIFVGARIVWLDVEDQAINIGCAQYNPTTGNFEWIGKKR